jgi:hypothetical protein
MSGYWALKSILDAQRRDVEAYNAQPPIACPNDGTPLQQNREGLRSCPMGDYTWRGGQRLT